MCCVTFEIYFVRGRGDGWMIDRNPREMDNRGNRGRGNRQNRFYGSMSPPPHDNNRGKTHSLTHLLS